MHFKKQVSRRAILKGAAAAAGAGPLLISGLNRAYAKVAKLSVSYRETPNAGKSCAICGNFIAPSSCKLVEGSINPNGWCGLFKPKA
jgi:anaerobic selenocysteine-containing dehydrogenase